VIVPAVAVHEVAPAETNCCFPPRASDTLAGEIIWGGIRVTTAEADPPDPVAVTVTMLEAGIVAGAV
jgi:hypothetical protein